MVKEEKHNGLRKRQLQSSEAEKDLELLATAMGVSLGTDFVGSKLSAAASFTLPLHANALLETRTRSRTCTSHYHT